MDESLRKLADEAVKVAQRQVETGLVFRKPRFDQIQANEDMYFGKERPALKGRFNIPFDTLVMRSYVRTLMSKIDEPVRLTFKSDENPRAAKKIEAAWVKESGPTTGKWDMKDRLAKKLAILSGRAIYCKYSESAPEFKDHLRVVDHWDFVTEPQGGAFLDDHTSHYELNVFKTRNELQVGAADGRYDRAQVLKLFSRTEEKDTKEAEAAYTAKQSRFAALNLDPIANNYVGEPLSRLTQGVMNFKGAKFWVVFDKETGIWVRFEPIKRVFESGLSPYTSWAADEEAFIFWSLAPADDIRPTAEGMRVTLNEGLSNLQRRNWDMRGYDMKKVPDPKQLEFRPDGLVGFNLLPGESINNAIYEFTTPDNTQIVVNMVDYLNSFLGEKAGVTPGMQGNADEAKVGIYFGNIQQVADRFGLLNRFYTQAHAELGQRFDWGLYEHAPEDYMVRILGPQGASWEKITKEERDLDYSVTPVSANAEAQANMVKAEKRSVALDKILARPELIAHVNPKKLAEQIFRFGEFEEEDIKTLMDTENYGSEEILAEAGMAIKLILEGGEPKKNLSATSGYIQKIVDFAKSNDLKPEVFEKLMAFAESHFEIAEENEGRRALMDGLVQPQDPNADPNAMQPMNQAPVEPKANPMNPSGPAF